MQQSLWFPPHFAPQTPSGATLPSVSMYSLLGLLSKVIQHRQHGQEPLSHGRFTSQILHQPWCAHCSGGPWWVSHPQTCSAGCKTLGAVSPPVHTRGGIWVGGCLVPGERAPGLWSVAGAPCRGCCGGFTGWVCSAVTRPPPAFPHPQCPLLAPGVTWVLPARLQRDTVYCLTLVITLCSSCPGAFLVKKCLIDYKTM